MSVPELQTRGVDVYKTEGPTEPWYISSVGTMKAAMVFIEFPDAKARWPLSDVAAGILANGESQELFHRQSYGRFTLNVDVFDQTAPQLSRGSDCYEARTFEGHKKYIEEVISLFPERDFSQFDVLLVVAPPNSTLPNSPAFNAHPAHGIKLPSGGQLNFAVTFGNDAYHYIPTLIVHELGHCLGLPDLYLFGVDHDCTHNGIGPWCLMGDIWRGTSFIGWHRHKLGWLPDTRKLYWSTVFNSDCDALETVLFPFSVDKEGGVSLIVVPAEQHDENTGEKCGPSKVFCVEIAEPIVRNRVHHKSSGSCGAPPTAGCGVLVYSVDCKVPSGHGPVELQPCSVARNDDFGDLFHAPVPHGATLRNQAVPFHLEVTHPALSLDAVACGQAHKVKLTPNLEYKPAGPTWFPPK
eukprot:TRINITY_DN20648_c0_g1_i1.p1 TRINITY_DN20648_c0_g1~~TRINITY_DN20648_c0_g1_i1.p1  ORF type:complete len:409 (+),score=35.03 TRINITY_DN20648_c0_g1_i1:45-1271(+)